MTAPGMRLIVLGTRGSIPVSDDRMRLFGGATSCYRVEAGEEVLYLDAGTGLLGAPCEGDMVHILLTHAHLDHLLGLPMWPALLNSSGEVHIYGRSRNGVALEAQLDQMISPPLWPIRLKDFPASVVLHELEQPFEIGPFHIGWMESCHPGGSLIFRIDAAGRRLVYATDYEHTSATLTTLTEFARNADLLLYDGSYTEDEYLRHRGFGHSTVEKGLYVQQASGAKRLLLVHHAPYKTDEALLAVERRLGVHIARQGEVIAL